MWKLLILIGVVLTGVALFYFLKLATSLINSYEFTDYGFGVLAGKIVLLIVGIILLYLGFKMKKNKDPRNNK